MIANRIDRKFSELKEKKLKAFVPFIMAGDPGLSVTEKLVLELDRQGASVIELGVPFSDPLADGPTIQRSAERALKKKISVDAVLNLIKSIRRKTDTPIVLLIYCNLIHHYGADRFVKRAVSCGADGVVIPDLPFEESGNLRRLAKKESLAVINLAAPTSSDARLKKICGSSNGFVYYVSITGTTGARKTLSAESLKGIRRVKKISKKPVCVGFGISSPEQARKISKIADGVIIGSAIIKIIEKSSDRTMVKDVGIFAGSITKALNSKFEARNPKRKEE